MPPASLVHGLLLTVSLLRFVESGFWNFDTLFVPQQHPARDLQDTFFISDPAKADLPRDENGELLTEYWDNIKEVHQDGKYGSLGYRYPWVGDESLKLVLRTHTTATSAAMLYKLAKNPRPARYFSIDRVFRNETVDATHLAEFHQVEGVIADFDLTLGDLIGFMNEFFGKMGVKNLRFKPAYNPYTEPSMEIFSYHEGLQKWVEIGNSGMFRPEMLESMGLPKGMKVHGWGLSLERPTMIKYVEPRSSFCAAPTERCASANRLTTLPSGYLVNDIDMLFQTSESCLATRLTSTSLKEILQLDWTKMRRRIMLFVAGYLGLCTTISWQATLKVGNALFTICFHPAYIPSGIQTVFVAPLHNNIDHTQLHNIFMITVLGCPAPNG